MLGFDNKTLGIEYQTGEYDEQQKLWAKIVQEYASTAEINYIPVEWFEKPH